MCTISGVICEDRHLHFDSLAAEVLAVARNIDSTHAAVSATVIEAYHPQRAPFIPSRLLFRPPSSEKTDVSAMTHLPGPICQATCQDAEESKLHSGIGSVSFQLYLITKQQHP
eukprot:s2215_g8.t1